MVLQPGEGHLPIGNADLEYRLIGPSPADAPTLVLLHEGLGCIALWRDFPDRLAEATGCGVFVFSRQGYGASSPCAVPRPLTYMHREGEETLPLVLAAIGFREGVLIGHSDGASIAAIHGGAHDDPRVRGLVLMAPHFFTEDMGLASIAEAKVAYETTELRSRLQRYHGDNVDCAFWGWNRAWLDPGFRAWDLTGYLPKISVPVLVIQGEDDQYGTRAQVDVVAERSGGPVEIAMLPDCGHSPFKDQGAQTLQETVTFVRRMLGRDTAASGLAAGRCG